MYIFEVEFLNPFFSQSKTRRMLKFFVVKDKPLQGIMLFFILFVIRTVDRLSWKAPQKMATVRLSQLGKMTKSSATRLEFTGTVLSRTICQGFGTFSSVLEFGTLFSGHFAWFMLRFSGAL